MLTITDFPVLAEETAQDLCFLFRGNKIILNQNKENTLLWRRAKINEVFGEIHRSVPVGLWNSEICYAVEITLTDLDPQQHCIQSVYALLGQVSERELASTGRALQLLNWRRNNQYCGRCGKNTTLGDSNRALQCSACSLLCYPRISPCVIVLITKGEKILLAAAKGRSKRFYSNVAGFIEAGETAEQAISREVREEVGISIHNIEYFGSQPWAFPDQLMLAYTAEHKQGEITVNTNELDDAQWFSVDNLPPVPPTYSISGQLIQSFIDANQKKR